MTEAEWLACNSALHMIWHLRSSGKEVKRKLRLFACGCCRRGWRFLCDKRSREAVEVSERYAEGAVATEALLPAQVAAEAAARAAESRFKSTNRGWAAAWAVHAEWVAAEAAALAALNDSGRETEWGEVDHVEYAAVHIQAAAGDAARSSGLPEPEARDAKDKEMTGQARLVRDLFGNPFHPAPLVETAWLVWNDGAVRKMAQSIYDERRFGDLPILADALEDAGCTDADILSHCRQPGEHVRGCWVIDLLLGKA
jgi:hypothetical protein